MPPRRRRRPVGKRPRKRFECVLLGKVIGTVSDWTPGEEGEQLFCRLRRSLFGKKFLPVFKDGNDLYIDFVTGYVNESKPDAAIADGTEREVRWEWFND